MDIVFHKYPEFVVLSLLQMEAIESYMSELDDTISMNLQQKHLGPMQKRAITTFFTIFVHGNWLQIDHCYHSSTNIVTISKQNQRIK